jgi:hypothetical protein
VLYFGDRHAYESSPRKVITVGLNSSHQEFPSDEPFRRFPDANGGDPDRHLGSLDSYFQTKPYTKWFNQAFEPLLNGLDCSYYDGQPNDGQPNIALHTDLCTPLPTNPTWSKLGPEVQTELQAEGGELWHDLVRLLRPDLLIVSVREEYLDLIQFPITQPWRVIYTVQREKKKPYEVRASCVATDGQKRARVVFGPAAQQPFGTISRDTKREIGELI